MIDKTKVAKSAVKLVVTHSVARVITNAIRINNPIPQNTPDKVRLYIGAVVIGTLVAEKAEDWTDRKFDELVAAIKDLKIQTPAS